jgi:hypothetical protein
MACSASISGILWRPGSVCQMVRKLLIWRRLFAKTALIRQHFLRFDRAPHPTVLFRRERLSSTGKKKPAVPGSAAGFFWRGFWRRARRSGSLTFAAWTGRVNAARHAPWLDKSAFW